MGRKLRVGVLFGGRSGEHEISLRSALTVMSAMDPARYDLVPIGITRDGRWRLRADAISSLRQPAAKLHALGRGGIPVSLPPYRHGGLVLAMSPGNGSAGTRYDKSTTLPSLDVIFPVLHGTFGEDGTIQGLLELADLPYVGAGVLGSAAGMDKDVMKSLFIAAGLPIVKHVTVLRSEWEAELKKVQKLVESKLKYPVFVKPANLGSSVGISKAHDRKELGPAIEEA